MAIVIKLANYVALDKRDCNRGLASICIPVGDKPGEAKREIFFIPCDMVRMKRQWLEECMMGL